MPLVHRDNYGRFASKFYTTPAPTFHNLRDEKGRFAPKTPLVPSIKQDSAGRWRNRLGHFVSPPVEQSPYYTVNELLGFIEKNGYPQIVGKYVSRQNGEILGACALGQGALNLGVEPTRFYKALEHGALGLASQIIALNDGQKLPLKDIVSRVRATRKYALNYLTNIKRKKNK